MSDYTDCTPSAAPVAHDRDPTDETVPHGERVLPPQVRPVGLPELPEDCGIRETLLWRFRDPGDDTAVRRLGGMLTELVNESGQFGPEGSAAADEPSARALHSAAASSAKRFSLPREELRAIALDLFYSARHLSEVAAERFASELTGVEVRLTKQAEGWAAHATVVAASIWDALGEVGSGAPT